MKSTSFARRALAGLIATSLTTAVWAGKKSTDPLGGNPPVGSKMSVEDLD